MSKEIQMGAVAKSYMRRDFLIYEEIRKYLVIYEDAVGHIWLCNRSHLNFLIYEENFLFFFISVVLCSLPTWGLWSRRQGRRQWWRGPGSPPSGSNPQAPPPYTAHQIETSHKVKTMLPRGRKFSRGTQLGVRIKLLRGRKFGRRTQLVGPNLKKFLPSQETPKFVLSGKIFLPSRPENSFVES